MLRLPRLSGESPNPPAVAPPEISSDGHDPEAYHLDPAEAAGPEAEKEAAEAARLETEIKANMLLMAGTLRAVLAERMVRAPTTEFEAVQVPDKDSLRGKREARKGERSKGRDGALDMDAVRSASKRLERGRSLKGKRSPGR